MHTFYIFIWKTDSVICF